MHFCLLSLSPDLRFNCYLRHFRGVQHFSRSLENHREEHPKLTQNDSQKALRDYEKGMKKSTMEKGGKHKEKGAQNGARKPSRRPSGKFGGTSPGRLGRGRGGISHPFDSTRSYSAGRARVVWRGVVARPASVAWRGIDFAW